MKLSTFYLVMVSFSASFFILMFSIYFYSIIVYDNRILAASSALMICSIFALFVSAGFFLCEKKERGE